MVPRPRSSLLLLLLVPLLALVPGSARGWSAATHRRVARRALGLLTPALRAQGRGHLDRFLEGAVAPDQRRAGWIPPRAHVFHREDAARRGGLAGRAVAGLEAWLRAQPTRGAAWWFQAGRLAHLVADLAQPLHTATSPEERPMHAAFEAWSARLSWPRRAPGVLREEPLPLEEVARRGRREYRRVVEQFGDPARRRALARRTRVWRGFAVQQVAARLNALGEASPQDSLPGRDWLLAAIAWWSLLELRLRARAGPLPRPGGSRPDAGARSAACPSASE